MMRAIPVFGLVALVLASAARAQDIPAAKGPGSYVAVGGTLSAVNTDYGQRELLGGTVFVDANVYNRFGVEAEARKLAFHSDDGTKMTTYLIGPRLSRDFRAFGSPQALRVYTKLMAGRGVFDFPYHYARGQYFVYAGAAGVDWRFKSRIILRVLDVEFERWPDFTFGQLRPFGVSSGVSFRVF
jgi:hypothetical protein